MEVLTRISSSAGAGEERGGVGGMVVMAGGPRLRLGEEIFVGWRLEGIVGDGHVVVGEDVGGRSVAWNRLSERKVMSDGTEAGDRESGTGEMMMFAGVELKVGRQRDCVFQAK